MNIFWSCYYITHVVGRKMSQYCVILNSARVRWHINCVSIWVLRNISNTVFSSHFLCRTAEVICGDNMYFYEFPILDEPEMFDVKLGLNLQPYQTCSGYQQQDITNCGSTKTPFTSRQNIKACWTLWPSWSYCNNTIDYKWSFVAYSFPHPLLNVPCGDYSITGLSHQGQQHF